jgi:hypothetical protein
MRENPETVKLIIATLILKVVKGKGKSKVVPVLNYEPHHEDILRRK